MKRICKCVTAHMNRVHEKGDVVNVCLIIEGWGNSRHVISRMTLKEHIIEVSENLCNCILKFLLTGFFKKIQRGAEEEITITKAPRLNIR